jgi:hypothetical protein
MGDSGWLVSELLFSDVSSASGSSGQNSRMTLILTLPFCQPLPQFLRFHSLYFHQTIVVASYS